MEMLGMEVFFMIMLYLTQLKLGLMNDNNGERILCLLTFSLRKSNISK